jgi:hypothetical protein
MVPARTVRGESGDFAVAAGDGMEVTVTSAGAAAAAVDVTGAMSWKIVLK